MYLLKKANGAGTGIKWSKVGGINNALVSLVLLIEGLLTLQLV